MSARWFAGSALARVLPTRRLGAAGARELAASSSPAEAVRALACSPYGRFVRATDSPAVARRGIAETLLWHLRVLAGWLPGDGVRVLRLLAGWFELANVDDRVRDLTGADQPAWAPFRLGTLATAWPRLARTNSLPRLLAALADSAWGDPGGIRPHDISLGLRLRWAERVAAGVVPARPWAAGAVALLVARDPTVRAERLSTPLAVRVDHVLGPGWSRAACVAELPMAVPEAAWALRGVGDPEQLWRAEARWWARLRTDGAELLAARGCGPDTAVGAAALLAVDAWLAGTALDVAAGTALDVAAGTALDVAASDGHRPGGTDAVVESPDPGAAEVLYALA
ncbi:hypothetical protein ACNTMW_00090 [Planosporangium sp. 12N6]|uniref:hypothetical protein n=1 Tax=Planosporangium spinosum TaxID=3402278 RepID=UPI003CF7B177